MALKKQYPRSAASKEANKLYARAHREQNKLAVNKYRLTERAKLSQRITHMNRAARNRLLINEMKADTPCLDCGRLFPPECMDFDHVRGEKKYNIGHLTTVGSTNMLAEEIAKCELVCACCHRTRTVKRSRARTKPAVGTILD